MNSKISQSLLTKIIDALPLPIFVKDEQSVFVLSNRKHGELIGFPEAVLLGNTASLLYGEEEGKSSRLRDLPVLESGEEHVVMRDYEFGAGETCISPALYLRNADVRSNP